jgi:UDP-glucose 4-epimerase
MSRYLITGGCGFIGSTLAQALIQKGHSVIILDNLSTGKRENAPSEAELVIGDFTEKSLLKQVIDGIDGCFHLAAIPSIEKSLIDWAKTHYINLFGTIQLFEIVRSLKQPIPIIYTSSAATYGNSGYAPLSEQDFPQPASPYGVDKLCGEWHAKLGWTVYQLPIISFRLFNVYGPRQDWSSSYSGVISRFAYALENDLPIIIYGDGEQRRDFIYVDDVVRFYIHVMESQKGYGEVFNICTGSGTSINDLAKIMGDILSKEIKIHYEPARKGDVLLSIGNPEKAYKFFQIKAKFSLFEGLSRMMKVNI